MLFTNLTAVGVGLAMYAMNLLAPQLLQLPQQTGYGLHLSLLDAGLWMVPAGLVMVVVSQVAARLTAARGPKLSLLVGIGIIAVGNGLAQAVLGHLWGVLLVTVSASAGVAFAYAAMPALIIRAVEPTQTGAANGLNSLARTLGTSTASAVIGVVLGQMTTTVGGAGSPPRPGYGSRSRSVSGAPCSPSSSVSSFPAPASGSARRPPPRSKQQPDERAVDPA